MAKSSVLSFFMTFTLIAFFIYSGAKVMSTTDTQLDIKEQIIEKVGSSRENLFWAGIFVKTLDHLTPQKTVYKIPFMDKDIFLVNRFPFIGWMHILIITSILLLLRLVASVFKIKVGWIFLAGLILIIMSYFIGSILDYYLYQYSAQKLGIAADEAKEFVKHFSDQLDNVMMTMFIFAMISLVTIFKYLFLAIKHRRKS
jgi:hypothetical protein